MKKLFSLLSLLLVVGCATEAHKQRVERREMLAKTGPQVGMPKSDIKLLYGDPRGILQTESGETWHYDNIGMLFIPFNFGYRLKMSNFEFDREGRLKKYSLAK